MQISVPEFKYLYNHFFEENSLFIYLFLNKNNQNKRLTKNMNVFLLKY